MIKEREVKIEVGRVYGNQYYSEGFRGSLAVDIEMELKQSTKDNLWNFSASGDIWNARHTDIVSGGQNLDHIEEHLNKHEFKHLNIKPEQLKRIVELWRKWHLNDLNPACIHQRGC